MTDICEFIKTMGADKKLKYIKCGEVLIHINTQYKRRKTYKFGCAYCDVNCDQLKKLSQHLEQEHFQLCSDEFEDTSLGTNTEIKEEERLETNSNDLNDEIKNLLEESEDPLETIEIITLANTEDIKLKAENVYNSKVIEYEESLEAENIYNSVVIENEESLKAENIYNSEVIENEEYLEGSDEEEYETSNNNEVKNENIVEESNKFKNTKKIKKAKIVEEYDEEYQPPDNNEMENDDFLEESDVEYKPPKKKSKKVDKTKKKTGGSSEVSSTNMNNGQLEIKNSNTAKKPKRIRKKDPNTYNKDIIKALFEAFEKQTNLWKIKERTSDKKTIQNGFEIIANEVNKKLNTKITWHFAKVRINALRFEYSYVLEKQRKGEEHEIPWYYEHMKYLDENIDLMIKQRYSKFRRRVKHLDLSILPILIELYKKNEELWQIDKITFGNLDNIKECFTQIIEEMKSNHNHDLTMDNVQDYIRYINTLYSKDKELLLKCELENIEFKPSSPFYEELKFLADSQGPFKCEICNELIQKYEDYHVHVADHHNIDKPFTCPVCKMGSKTYDLHLKHTKRHLNVKNFACEICGKAFVFKSELRRHDYIHTGLKPFLCQICGSSFRDNRDYDNHIRRHEQRFRYECHICKHGFNQLCTLNDHVKSHLNIRDIFCDICGKSFTAQRYLNNHKLIHEEKKRYKCMVCGKEFAQGASYRTHRKQHQPHLTAAEIKRKKQQELMEEESAEETVEVLFDI